MCLPSELFIESVLSHLCNDDVTEYKKERKSYKKYIRNTCYHKYKLISACLYQNRTKESLNKELNNELLNKEDRTRDSYCGVYIAERDPSCIRGIVMLG